MSFSGNTIYITPTVYITETKYVTSLRYEVTDFVIFDHISFRVILYDQNSSPLDVKNITLTHCEYANWGNNDAFLVKLLVQKLGLSINFPLFSHLYSSCPIIGTDASGNNITFTNLLMDGSGNINLQKIYSRDTNNMIIDMCGNQVLFEILNYDYHGKPFTFNSLPLDGSNNPILPVGYTVDASSGVVNDASGEQIVIVSNIGIIP